jgi:uncharacterized protein (TIGR02466 family)
MEIFPLFASNLVSIILKENLSLFSSEIKKTSFYDAKLSGSKKSLASNDLKILKKYTDIESIILNNFQYYAKNVLDIDNNFIISTSWITKVDKGSYSQLHSHKNSFYSGVLYFDEYDVNDTGKLEFYSPVLPHTDFLILPKNYNIFNSSTWTISPQKNLLIFFPSYLYHQIIEHSSENTRYSLAFNIVPTGEYGTGDSLSNAVWNY